MSNSSTYLDRWRAEREQQRRRDQLAEQQLNRIREQREAERQRQARDEALRAQVLDALSVRKRNERKQETRERRQHQDLLAEALQTQREKRQQAASPKQLESGRPAAQERTRTHDPKALVPGLPDRDRNPKTRSGITTDRSKDRTQEQATRQLKLTLAGQASQQNKQRKDDVRRQSVGKIRAASRQELAKKKISRDLALQRKMPTRDKPLQPRAELRISPPELPPRAARANRLSSLRAPAPLPPLTGKGLSRSSQPGAPLPDDSPLSWLSTQGGFLVDENGNAVHLRGVTVTGLDTVKPAEDQTVAQALTLDDVGLDVLANGWGVNLIRIPFTSSSILSGNIALTAEGILQGIDDLIAQAEAAGCYVLLALKPLREATGILPADDDYLCMRALATRYRDQPAVLYEPFASTSLMADNWLGIAQAVIGTIRREHQGSLLFLGNGKGTASVDGLPLVFTSGDPIYNLAYTLRLAPSVLNAVQRESLLALSRDYPLFVSEWSDGGPDFGRSSAFASDLIGRVGAGWAASNWNTEPSLVTSAGAHKFSATRWGMVVQRTLAQPLRPLLISYSSSTSQSS